MQAEATEVWRSANIKAHERKTFCLWKTETITSVRETISL